MRDLEMHETNGITFLAVAEAGDTTYFSAWNHNGLFQLHKDGTTKFIMLFDKYGETSPRHEFAIKIKDSIMFIPSSSENEIAIFTPGNKKIEYLEYPPSAKKCLYRPFWGYTQKGDTIYLLPNSYDAVLAFDQRRQEFFRYILPIENDAFYEDKSVVIGGITVGETVYFCPWNHNEILSFNLQSFTFDVLGRIAKNTFRHMFYMDGKLFLLPRVLSNNYMVYDLESKELQEKNMPSVMQGICVCMFTDNLGNIYLLPDGKNKFWLWNPLSDTLNYADIKIDNNEPIDELCFNESRDLWNGKIIFAARENLSALQFDGNILRPFDIDKGKGLFLDILISMVENHDGRILYESL